MADWDLFCDESKDQDGKRYLAYGGIMLPRHTTDRLSASIDGWCKKVGLLGEMKWRKTRQSNIDRYCTYTRGAMHYINGGTLRFATAVFDLQNHRYEIDNVEPEGAISRAYRFLLHCFALNLSPGDRLFIYPDQGFLDCIPEKFVAMLNRGIEQHKRWRNVRIVRTFEQRKSEEHHLIQMADVLTGAVAAASHKCHKLDARSGAAKQRLIEHVAKLSGRDLTRDTPITAANFRIWFPPAQKSSAGIPTSLAKPRVQTGPATP